MFAAMMQVKLDSLSLQQMAEGDSNKENGEAPMLQSGCSKYTSVIAQASVSFFLGMQPLCLVHCWYADIIFYVLRAY